MKQKDLGLDLNLRRTRKQTLLDEMEHVMPWSELLALIAGSELAGQRAAVVMSLLQSAKLHGHDPWAYLKDVLTRLPSHMNSRIDELLPHRWQPGQCQHNADA